MFSSPYPAYSPTEKEGFSYETVVYRWPKILTGVVDQLSQENHKLFMISRGEGTDHSKFDAANLASKIEEGQNVVEKVSRLKYEMGRDYPLANIEDDEELPECRMYNQELESLKEKNLGTWMTCPWLYAECYLYRLLRSYFAPTAHWKDYDPFRVQKIDTFKKSSASIRQLALTMHELETERDKLDEPRLAVLWKEMVTMALWGNATDLSLLTHLSMEDIENLQTVGKEAQLERKKFILKDDQDAAWERLKSMENGRVDFILDNAGFEVFTDLVFADFLVTYTPYVSNIVFHGKLIPWFVSDVTPADFVETIHLLLDDSFFATNTATEDGPDYLKAMAKRWAGYVEDGTFTLSVPVQTLLGGRGIGESNIASIKNAEFWTMPYPYWNMETLANGLWKTLTDSGLVIFKGDLNYRRLTGDVDWPFDTPFKDALGPLAGSFPLLSLRTNKADVVVGVDMQTAEELQRKEGRKWRVDGRYALISFADKQRD